MKQIVKMSLAILSLAFFTSSASAAIPGAYVGGGLGYSRLETPNEYLVKGNAGKVFDQSRKFGGVGGRLFAGYNFNEYIGLEAGFANFAKSKYETKSPNGSRLSINKEFTMMSGDLVAKAYLPIPQSGFNLYALGGVALAHSKAEISGKLNSPLVDHIHRESKTQNKLRPKFGLGASYDIPQTKLTTNLEWSRIQGSGNVKKGVEGIPSADMITLNLAYNFD